MKRSERRLLEEKLRYVAMEDIELDPQRDQEILEQVKAKFEQRQLQETKESPSRGTKIGRRVIMVAATVVVLLVVPFVYTVLMPESVSHARGFVRSAAIWVNNTLHLGYDFEEPVEKPSQHAEGDVIYSSLEEAAENIPYPLVYLDDPRVELRAIMLRHGLIHNRVIISYSIDDQPFNISLLPIGENTTTDMAGQSIANATWQCGELFCWNSDPSVNAITYYSGMEINIQAENISQDIFLDLCRNLKPVN